MERYYYAAEVEEFMEESEESILGKLSIAHRFDLDERQKQAWLFQTRFLKQQLPTSKSGHVFFEYSIPRMGKRVDVVLIWEGKLFVIEFKVGADRCHHADQMQVLDYALDLKNFHAASHQAEIIPVLVATGAPSVENEPRLYDDMVWSPLCVNQENFGAEQESFGEQRRIAERVDPYAWKQSAYYPTPTIVEAAQALYRGHDVEEISRSEAANIGATTDAITAIIERTRSSSEKAIIFVTGVPGSGKTLAGLNLASEHFRVEHREHAVFLSGNGPLVEVLQEALARYENETSDIRKSEARSKAKAFI